MSAAKLAVAVVAVSIAFAHFQFHQPQLSARLLEWRGVGRTFTYAPTGDVDKPEHAIFYIDIGNNAGPPTILLLHGYPTSSYDWQHVLPDLVRQNYRVVTFDYLGFGFSDKPLDHPFSVSEQADIAEEILSLLKIKKVHILAHDLGDTVAQELIARHATKDTVGKVLDHLDRPKLTIASACLLNGGLFPETHRRTFAQKAFHMPYVGPFLAYLVGKSTFEYSMLKTWGSKALPTEAEMQDMWDVVSFNNGKHYLPIGLSYLDQRVENRERWVGALQQAIMPVKFVNGPADPVSGAHMVARYQELIPKPNVEVLDSTVGHWPLLEDYDRVIKVHSQFLLDVDMIEMENKKNPLYPK